MTTQENIAFQNGFLVGIAQKGVIKITTTTGGGGDDGGDTTGLSPFIVGPYTYDPLPQVTLSFNAHILPLPQTLPITILG